MFEFFRKHTWLLQVVLGFVVLAFVGGGVYQGYGSMVNDENTTVAKSRRPEGVAHRLGGGAARPD